MISKRKGITSAEAAALFYKTRIAAAAAVAVIGSRVMDFDVMKRRGKR